MHRIDGSDARILAQVIDNRLVLEAFFNQKIAEESMNRCEMFLQKVFIEFWS